MSELPRGESRVQRRKRFMLRRRAQWAHVEKRGPKRLSFRRFWHKSRFRDPSQDLAGMNRQERRALAKSTWRVQKAIQSRAARGD